MTRLLQIPHCSIYAKHPTSVYLTFTSLLLVHVNGIGCGTEHFMTFGQLVDSLKYIQMNIQTQCDCMREKMFSVVVYYDK